MLHRRRGSKRHTIKLAGGYDIPWSQKPLWTKNFPRLRGDARSATQRNTAELQHVPELTKLSIIESALIAHVTSQIGPAGQGRLLEQRTRAAWASKGMT